MRISIRGYKTIAIGIAFLNVDNFIRIKYSHPSEHNSFPIGLALCLKDLIGFTFSHSNNFELVEYLIEVETLIIERVLLGLSSI